MRNAVCKSVLFGEVQLHHWPSSILFAPARPGLLFSVAFKAYSIEKKLCSNSNCVQIYEEIYEVHEVLMKCTAGVQRLLQ